MGHDKEFRFKAKIYKTGINYCVDVPVSILRKMTDRKGFIKIKGTINDFTFEKSLVPVKEGAHRLFVNLQMLKNGNAKVGGFANFVISINSGAKTKIYAMPQLLQHRLEQKGLLHKFQALTTSRKNDILKYLDYLKSDVTRLKNIEKLLTQLETNEGNVRIP